MKLALSLVLALGTPVTATPADAGRSGPVLEAGCPLDAVSVTCGPQTQGAYRSTTLLAQLSRDEHDRLRLELRGLHRPVRVGSLEELGVASRLSASERRLLRRQLREQLAPDTPQTAELATGSVPGMTPDTSDRVGGEAPEPLQMEVVAPAVTAQPDPIRLDSPLLEVQAPLSINN